MSSGRTEKHVIEIKIKDNHEAADIAGHSIAEARGLYKAELGIADKAVAVLNGRKIGSAAETLTILKDNDNLEFKTAKGHKAMYLVGALLLAMAVTGGVFAFGYTNATATINAITQEVNFADVTANTSSTPTWTAHGMQKNQTGSGTLFDVNTGASGYTGDFVATVSLANIDDLTKIYRNLTLSIEVRDSANNLVDINSDNISDNSDYTILTLENSAVTLNIKQAAPGIYTILLRNGYFICNVGKISWTSSDGTPVLYCELAQR